MDQQAQALVSLTPALQWGFAGFALIQLGVIVLFYVTNQKLINRNSRVMARLTTAIQALRDGMGRIRNSLAAIKRDLDKRPCAAQQAMREAGLHEALPPAEES